ncbi:MAG: energy transducer TonB [Bacteroidia bacterium]
MKKLNKPLSIILAALLIPGLIQAQLSFEPASLLSESEANAHFFTSPSPINMQEVQMAIRYPETAQEAGKEGLVVCKILVDEQGNYMRHRVTQAPDPSLREAVSPHLARLRFVPAVKNGKAVAAWTTLRFAFKLEDGFSTPKPDKAMQTQIWEQSAQAQMDAGKYAYALELYERAIAMQRTASNQLLEKAAFAAISAQNYVQASRASQILLNRPKAKPRQARILYLRAKAQIYNKTTNWQPGIASA